MNQPTRRVPPLRQIKTYRKPMKGWFLHGRRTYLRYMVRELTSVAVAYYALLVLYGLFQLRGGPEAFNGFIAALGSPLWLLVNVVTLGLVGFHAFTWFEVMPKTMPLVFIRRRAIPDRLIVAGGLAGLAGASLALLVAFLLTAP